MFGQHLLGYITDKLLVAGSNSLDADEMMITD